METHFSIASSELPPLAKINGKLSGSAPSLAGLDLSNNDFAAGIDLDAVQKQQDKEAKKKAKESQTSISKAKGLRKIFGKLRRSSSENMEDHSADRGDDGTYHQKSSPPHDFNIRGAGFRSSSGSRFSDWGNDNKKCLELPLNQWTSEMVLMWLEQLGLSAYASEAKKCLKSGSHLLDMNSYDLETKLNMRNNLHRKKLLLALDAKQRKDSGEELSFMSINMDRLDHQWIVRWLDDVGLPQYKDRFVEARVDARVLNLLNIDDLLNGLKVSNQLHHLSIKRGIQVLRQCHFDHTCLRRRCSHSEGQNQSTEVVFWTNHRVMEWLKSVDLAEYAPNLRGSGVHGALMVYEPKFTSELLAALLSIPASKSLLRRHLSLHYKDLVGKEVMMSKREAEQEPHHQPLTPSAKVRPFQKRSQFTLTRKTKKSNAPFEDAGLLCPWNENLPSLALPETELYEQEVTNGDLMKGN